MTLRYWESILRVGERFYFIAFKGLGVREVLSSETSENPYPVTQFHASVAYGHFNDTAERTAELSYLSNEVAFLETFAQFMQYCHKGKPLANQETN